MTAAPSLPLAMPINPVDRASDGLVLGARMWIRAFSRALVEHTTLERLRLFTAAPLVGRARTLVDELASRRATPLRSLEVSPQTQLAEAAARGELFAYHEPDLGTGAMFRVRQAYATRAFPITLLHHSFSYRAMLHDTFLRLLLDDTRPCDAVICSSRAARQAITTILDTVADRFASSHGARLAYRGRLDVLPLGIDTDVWRPRDRGDLRAQLGWPAGATILLYLGRFSAADKADLVPLLDVFARLVRDLPTADLVLVLAGSERDGAGQVLERHVDARGLRSRVRFVIDPRTPHLLIGAADVFVSPADNIQEAFGLTPLEAMASGTPQVVADWDGYRETVVDGETGFLIPTTWAACDEDLSLASPLLSREWLDHLALAQSVVVDPQLLYRRLRELIEQPTLRRTMGEASRARAVAEFSWPVVIARYEALWHELSAIAQADPRAADPRPTYGDPAFWSAFRHYATRALTGSELVRATVAGTDIATGEIGMPASHGTIDPAIATDALHLLAAAPGATLPFAELEQQLVVRRRLTTAAARRHLLWLAKYALVELGD